MGKISIDGWRVSALYIGAFVGVPLLHAAAPLEVCQVLDRSNELNGQMITVHGYITGSPQHGYSLFASPVGSDEPCPGWRQRFLTAPSVIELRQPVESSSGGEQYRELCLQMNRRYEAHDYSTMEVLVEGRLLHRWLTLINKHSSGAYIGNGFGQNGGRAAILQVKSIHEVTETKRHPK